MGVVERLAVASHLVRERLEVAAESARQWYNNKASNKFFCDGDPVVIYSPRKRLGRSAKWQSFFKTESAIKKRLNDATYVAHSKAWTE